LEKFYSCEQISERYNVKLSTVWEWIRLKRLPAVKIGRLYRISERDLIAFENSNRTTSE